MCVISFEGVCYFERDRSRGRVTVHLPAADLHETHLDGAPAAPHHARIFVHRDLVDDEAGFFDCRFEPVDKDGNDLPTVHGMYFPLSRGARAAGYTVRVAGQGRGPVDQGDLDSTVPSFATFAGGLPSSPDPDSVAASLVLSGGTLTTYTSLNPWRIQSLDGPGPVSLGAPAWRIDWDTGAAAGSPVRISVIETLADGRELEVGHVVVGGGTGPIIIGNLDTPNPASWIYRKPPPTSDEGIRSAGPDTTWPDVDFKWLYRLFDPVLVKRVLADAGRVGLPVPELDGFIGPTDRRVRNEEGELIAFDTPTCFPGGD